MSSPQGLWLISRLRSGSDHVCYYGLYKIFGFGLANACGLQEICAGNPLPFEPANAISFRLVVKCSNTILWPWNVSPGTSSDEKIFCCDAAWEGGH